MRRNPRSWISIACLDSWGSTSCLRGLLQKYLFLSFCRRQPEISALQIFSSSFLGIRMRSLVLVLLIALSLLFWTGSIKSCRMGDTVLFHAKDFCVHAMNSRDHYLFHLASNETAKVQASHPVCCFMHSVFHSESTGSLSRVCLALPTDAGLVFYLISLFLNLDDNFHFLLSLSFLISCKSINGEFQAYLP